MPYLGNVPSSFNVGTNNIDNGSVTTEKIADGAVVNADVNASAAIAGTKISPDFGSQNLLTTGTATAASLIPTSSTAPTNGLFLPAANTVGISTGGSQRATIDSSGRLLVGTSSVSHNSRAVIAGRQDGNAGGTLVLESTSSSPANGDTLGNLRYGTSGNTASLAAAAIGAERDGGTWTNNSSMPARLTFSTTADGASSPTERLRITSAGLVGIGTTSPGAPLDVVTGSSGAIFRFSTASTNLQIIPEAANGNVGIRFAANSGAAPNLQFRNDAGSNLVTITNGGAVGIGITAPTFPLHILQSAGGSIVNFTNNVDADFQVNCTSGVTTAGPTSGQLALRSNSIERVRLDNSGRLLVGTSSSQSTNNHSDTGYSPKSQFVITDYEGVASFTNWTNSVGMNNNGGTVVFFNRCTSNSSGTHAGGALVNGDKVARLVFNASDGTAFRTAASIEVAMDGTTGASDVPGRLVFSTTADGASSPTERLRIANDGSISSVIPGGSTLFPRFGCRAWVNFNGTGTVAIRANGNVSSITDNGTGDYTVNFTTALADANYSVMGCVREDLTDTSLGGRLFQLRRTPSLSSSIRVGVSNLSNAAFDEGTVTVAVFR